MNINPFSVINPNLEYLGLLFTNKWSESMSFLTCTICVIHHYSYPVTVTGQADPLFNLFLFAESNISFLYHGSLYTSACEISLFDHMFNKMLNEGHIEDPTTKPTASSHQAAYKEYQRSIQTRLHDGLSCVGFLECCSSRNTQEVLGRRCSQLFFVKYTTYFSFHWEIFQIHRRTLR